MLVKVPANRIRHPGRARAWCLAVFGVMVAVLVSGCGTAAVRPSASPSSTSRSTSQPSASPTPQTSDLLAGITVSAADVQASAGAGNALAVDLLQQLASSQPDANFVDSAYSLATALAMLELGAEGDTQTQIGTVLHSAGVTPEQQAAAWKQLDASLLATAQADGISLDVANAIWLQQGLPFNATFLNTLVQNFSAPSS
jgi:serpin B